MATYLNNYASLKWGQDHRDEAKLLYEKALAMGLKSLVATHLTVIDIKKLCEIRRMRNFFASILK